MINSNNSNSHIDLLCTLTIIERIWKQTYSHSPKFLLLLKRYAYYSIFCHLWDDITRTSLIKPKLKSLMSTWDNHRFKYAILSLVTLPSGFYLNYYPSLVYRLELWVEVVDVLKYKYLNLHKVKYKEATLTQLILYANNCGVLTLSTYVYLDYVTMW